MAGGAEDESVEGLGIEGQHGGARLYHDRAGPGQTPGGAVGALAFRRGINLDRG